MKKLAIIFSCLFLSVSFFAQQREVNIITTKLTDQIYMLKGQGGNIGLFLGAEAVFMIDDQFAPLTPKILKAIQKITNKPVSYLINTHWHGDHTGGNENMEKEGALIVAHDNVRKRMSVDQVVRGRTKKASPKSALPVITFSEDMMMHINDDDILITHIHNAHTDGDAVIYFTKNNVLHTGDAYFQGKFPYIDLNSGGSIEGYIGGIHKMILLVDDDTKIVPGHGGVSNKKEMVAYLTMLKDLKNKTESEIKLGKTLSEIVKNKTITKNYKSFIGWINEEKIITAIYKSLEKNR